MSDLIAGRILGDPPVAGWVQVSGDRISDVGTGSAPGRPTVTHDGLIAPGLCDLQVNGAAGVEVTDGSGALDRIDAAMLAHGVTSYLPTVITTDEETAQRTVSDIAERVADPSSPVEGAHLEGPFLSEEFRGVHRREHLRLPPTGTPPYYDDPSVRLITIAPEIPGAMDLISKLVHRPALSVSLGHSGATAAQADQAISVGATCVTHLFNAARPLHHREPGLVGHALLDKRVSLGVIADGLHVAPAVLLMVRKLAGDRVLLVSDSSPAAAAPPGRYMLAGLDIERTTDGRSQTLEGALAGSSLTLDQAVRRWIQFTEAPVGEALVAAGERPARLIGLDVGLRRGAFADLILLTPDGEPVRTMRRGRWVE